MAEKATVMVLKVDLQCPCCYNKVKKILCKFPQIRNQVYDEKANTVTITVVCCDPEKIRDKLCCKGAKVIKSIKIKEPQKQKEKPPSPTVEEKPPLPPPPPVVEEELPSPVVEEKPPPPVVEEKPPPPVVELKPPEKHKEVPVCEYPPAFPRRTCCGECYHGYGGGPCYHGFGNPEPPPVVEKKPPEKHKEVPLCEYPPAFPGRTCCGECYRDGFGNRPPPEVALPLPKKHKEVPKCYPPPKSPVPAPVKPAPIPVCEYPPAFPRRTCCGECYHGYGGGPCYHGFGNPPRPVAALSPPKKHKEVPQCNPPPKPPAPAPVKPAPVPVCEYPRAFPGRTCCGECYHGYDGGPCYHGFGNPPPPCYDGYYDYRRGCHVSRCDYYFSEENPQSCSLM